MDKVYQTGETNSADGLSHRPNDKAAAEAENRRKQADEKMGDSLEGTRSSVGKSEEGREEVARISTAQQLGP